MGLSRLFGGTYAGRRVLVTGHTGFKGSWLALWLRRMGAEVAGLALDPDTSPAHWPLLALGEVADFRVDLRDAAAVRIVLEECRPEIVFHLAAQPLVRRSYREPVATYASNVMGLVHLFEAVRGCPSVRALVNATTDKVYAADEPPAGGHREGDALGGHDPYSTSKACAELVSQSYARSYFRQDDGRGHAVRLATARAGNVIGGGDWAEDRLVPDLVRAAIAGKPLRLRHPDATRPWQHVLEPLSGYLALGQALLSDAAAEGAWNFGPEAEGETSVGELAAGFARHWPALRIERDEGAHPHEAAVLRLDSGKARRELGWRPVWSLDTAIARSVAWYRGHHERGEVGTMADLEAYVRDAQALGLGWAA